MPAPTELFWLEVIVRHWLLQLIGACSLFAATHTASAAEISHRTIVDDIEGIVLVGDITASDAAEFRALSLRYKKAVVILSSNGGALMPAIEIGKIIKLAGFVTFVPNDAVCASSCALIWVAGTTRLLGPKGRVGFHASYRTNNGKPEESGVANALVGNYLTLLNLSERAVIFATRASPDRISWLTKANKATAGIEFEELDITAEASRSPNSSKSAASVAPPTIYTGAPPSVKQSPSTSGWVIDPQNPNRATFTDDDGKIFEAYKPEWFDYADDLNGTKYLYKTDSVKRSAGIVEVWEKWDHSEDGSVAYRTTLRLTRMSCASKMAMTASSVSYDRTGRVVSSTEGASDYRYLVPESVGMALWEELCL